MLKKLLSYWLVLLIMIQSNVTFADAIKIHQPREQYLSFEFTQTEITQLLLFETSTQFSNDGLDCYLYCYCHLYLSYSSSISLVLLSPLKSLELDGSGNITPNGLLSSVFRPPK